MTQLVPASVGSVGETYGAGVKPRIETVWFDLTLRVLLPDYTAGITRTVERVHALLKPADGLNIRYCVVLPGVGFGEVDPDWLADRAKPKKPEPDEADDAPPARAAKPLPPVELNPLAPEPVPDLLTPKSKRRRKRSRFWIIPWRVRHAVRNIWWEPPEPSVLVVPVPAAAPAPPPPRVSQVPHYPPYPPGSILRTVQFGPKDLFLSLGGQWLVAGTDETILKKKRAWRFHQASLVYDLIPINAPQLCDPNLVTHSFIPCTQKQLLASDLVFTISEYSKREIVEYCDRMLYPTPPVEVFYLGSDIPGRAHAAGRSAATHRPFVLTVGSLELRKNQLFLYYAWKKLLDTVGPDRLPLLVLAGKPGWRGDVIRDLIATDPQLKEHVLVKTDPSDAELNWMYANCLFTAYPSIYEGWGLPVEESFAYGKMCVTTTASSLPEVGGEFAEYAAPNDLEGLVAALTKALDPEYRRKRERHIRDHFRPHTWEQAARQVQAILEKHYEFTTADAGA